MLKFPIQLRCSRERSGGRNGDSPLFCVNGKATAGLVVSDLALPVRINELRACRVRLKSVDNLRKTCIPAKRGPGGIKFELAIIGTARPIGEIAQAFDRRILLTQPSIGHGETGQRYRAIYCILGYRAQLNGAVSFRQRFFLSPQSGIDHTKNSTEKAIVRIIAQLLSNFVASNIESYD